MLSEGAVVLQPVRPVRALLRLDQAEERYRLRQPGADARDQIHYRDRFRGVLGLQRVLPTVPDHGLTGGLRLNAVIGASFKTKLHWHRARSRKWNSKCIRLLAFLAAKGARESGAASLDIT